MRLGRVIAWAKGLLAHGTLVIEFCHDCGRQQPVTWTASDALWERFADGQRPLCPGCFDRRARRAGVHLRWIPQVACRGKSWVDPKDQRTAGASE